MSHAHHHHPVITRHYRDQDEPEPDVEHICEACGDPVEDEESTICAWCKSQEAHQEAA